MEISLARLSPATWIVVAAFLAGGCVDDTVRPEGPGSPSPPALSVAAATTVTELEPLPGEESASAFAVNASAQVVGSSGDHAVLWENGQPTELPVLDGATRGAARDINDAGQATGEVVVDGRARAVLWDEGGVIEIGWLPGHDRSLARAISNEGHVVGVSTASSVLTGTGFLWQEGEMIPLPPLPGDQASTALFVSSAGVAVGLSVDTSDDSGRFVRWENGEGTEIAPTLFFDSYDMVGKTDEGVVVLSAEDGEDVLLWFDGTLTVVPSPNEDAIWYAASGASPEGLILGVFALPPCCFNMEWGIWHDDDFIRFTPPVPCVAIGDGGHVVCRGNGRSVLMTVPLGSPAPEGIAELLAFFDEGLSSGTLEGSGPARSGEGRAGALRNLLERAAAFIEEGHTAGACTQLNQALRRSDGLPRPPDFVEGPAAPELAERIRLMIDALGC
jgi:probable HAF family extracellular repeat protein